MYVFRRTQQMLRGIGSSIIDHSLFVFRRGERAVPVWRRLRRSVAPGWRKLLRTSMVILGLSVFFGLEYLLSRGIMSWDRSWFIILTTAIALLAIIIAFKNSAVMLALWLVLVPWTWYFPLRSAKYYLQFDLLTLTLLTLVAIPKFLVRRRRLTRLNIAEWLLILTVLYCSVWPIIRFGPNESQSIISVTWQLLLVPGVIYFLTKIALESEKQIKLMIGAIAVIGILWTLSGFYEHFTGYQWHSILTGNHVLLTRRDVGLGRAVGPSDSQVTPGTVLSAAALVLLHLIGCSRRNWARIVGYVCFGCMSVAVFFTYTRISYGGFVVALVVAFMISIGRRIQYGSLIAVITVAVVLAIPKIASDPEFSNRMSNPRNYYQRMAMSQTAYNIAKDYFWFGAGDIRQQNILEKYVSSWEHPRLGAGKFLAFPDNNYLVVFAMNGIFGFLFHFGAILGFIAIAFKMRKKLPAQGILGSNLASTAVAYAVVVLVAMTVTQLYSQPYLYYLMFMLFAMVVRTKEILDEREEAKATDMSLTECRPDIIARAGQSH